MSKEDKKFLKFLTAMMIIFVISILLMKYTMGDDMRQAKINAHNQYYHGEGP